MSITVANTVIASHTYKYLVDRVNELADAMTNYVVTAGSPTSGNVVVNNFLDANNLAVRTSLRGGNTTTANILYITSNVEVNSAMLTFQTAFSGNSTVNTTINSTGIFISGSVASVPSAINVQTTGTSTQVIDQFAMATVRTAEYVFSIKENGGTGYQSSKILVCHNGTTALSTEYAVVNTAAMLGVFSSDISGANCRVLFTPTVSNTQVKATRIVVPV